MSLEGTAKQAALQEENLLTTLDTKTHSPSTSKEEEVPGEKSYQLIDKEDQVGQAIATLGSETMLAFDCEGVNLGRDGSLTLLQISARDSPCCLFDIQKLGKIPFDLGLKRILEDKKITKLMFDCKEDSDALAHIYDVCLDGVYDIQLYEMMYREVALDEEKIQEPKFRRGWHPRLPTRAGMSKCIERYLKEDGFLHIKERGKELLSTEDNIWEKRPIDENLLEYAAMDTRVPFLLFDHFKKRLPLSKYVDKERLRVSSERFVKYFRDLPFRTYDKYEKNGFLPLNIIPNVIWGRLDTSVPYGNTKCIGCKRNFPRSEFTYTQLSRGEQKCKVCKEIKRLENVEENRQDNFRLVAERENDYISDGEYEYKPEAGFY